MSELQLSREAISALRSADNPRTQLVLTALKAAIARVDEARADAAFQVAYADEVRAELTVVGISLKEGHLLPQQAIDRAEAISPGILSSFPPLSGLGITPDKGDDEPAESEAS